MKETAKLTSLADACDFILDGTHGSPERTPDGIRVLSAKNVTDGRLTLETERFTSENEYEKYRRRLDVQPGDVLLTIVGTIGRAAVVNTTESFVFQRSVAVLRPQAELTDSRYLYYCLGTSEVDRQLKKRTNQSSQAGIYLKKLATIQIPLPPLPEQKRIADILDKADTIRRKRQALVDYGDQFLKATFLDMFGDPATNPRGLPLRQLKEFYTNSKEGTKCGPFGGALKKHEYVSSGVSVWNMDNISTNGRMLPKIRLWISEGKYDELSAYAVHDGDILISRAGTVGKMCVIRAGLEKSIISTNLIRLRLNSALLPDYFVSLMIYCKGRVGRLKTGPDGSFTHMSTGVLDTLTFPYPTPEDQRAYVDVMDSVKVTMDHAEKAHEESDALFNALVQRAFKGEL
jgi:type I restriction enzyme, S subunit